jgi:hypothetical protein
MIRPPSHIEPAKRSKIPKISTISTTGAEQTSLAVTDMQELDQRIPGVRSDRWNGKGAYMYPAYPAFPAYAPQIKTGPSSSQAELMRLWEAIDDQVGDNRLGDAHALLQCLYPFRKRLPDRILPIFYARLGVCTLWAQKAQRALLPDALPDALHDAQGNTGHKDTTGHEDNKGHKDDMGPKVHNDKKGQRQAWGYFAQACAWFAINQLDGLPGVHTAACLFPMQPTRDGEYLKMYEFCKRKVVELE